MEYKNIVHGNFEQRLNRFVAEVVINGRIELVHVKNTGRCKELLIAGVPVLLEHVNNPNRKTKYSLISVLKGDRWVNIDSQAPNKVAFETIEEGKIIEVGKVDHLKAEVTFQSSRFDLYYEKGDEKGFIEVKGVTLEKDGIAMFPDAPTTRGTKHVLELIDAISEGYHATILFIIQMKGCRTFTPHLAMDPALTEALIKARQKGVRILAYDCVVGEDSLVLDQPIPVQLPKEE